MIFATSDIKQILYRFNKGIEDFKLYDILYLKTVSFKNWSHRNYGFGMSYCLMPNCFGDTKPGQILNQNKPCRRKMLVPLK